MTIDAISSEYVSLAFAIEKHAEGFVDAYYGPPEAREHGLKRDSTPQVLLDDVRALRRDVAASDYPERRKAYLDAQIRAMETMARKAAGEEVSYIEEVRGCFDIDAAHTPEALFDQAAAELDDLLPGSGTIAERRHLWQQRFEVSPDVARMMIDTIAAEARTRTSTLVPLPAHEAVDFAMVSDKPWSGYNWYLGKARSLVECNTDLPMRANATGRSDLPRSLSRPPHRACAQGAEPVSGAWLG